MFFVACSCFSWSFDMKNDFPETAFSFKSGSNWLVNCMLKSRKPLKTDSTTNNAMAPTIIPAEAILLIMFIALLLLLPNKYRLAMYNEKFKFFMYKTLR